jgi:hypothetical protein
LLPLHVPIASREKDIRSALMWFKIVRELIGAYAPQIVICTSLRDRFFSLCIAASITPDVVIFLRGVAKCWSAAARYAKQAQNTSD